ncbi:MAG: metalloregulator ArsR/SmtB family transcription factor [Ferrovibrio sp.]|uniref:ArsR/SmtB family transcription factor n=1 Tax=Ferrovibrio sp. TaxID=1917215 RepID=UPI00261D7118|nr:metalloregulator ArsR/SmtB family transcription factor [Ferrovibrio sp.]MCW0234640.1 metalloregulator ArsR/SmtB family transcription factor [Ferrovibrio sp.]
MAATRHPAAPDPLSATLAALADPTRRAILAALVRGPQPVGQLAAPLGLSLPAISKHLTVLERAGLVSRHRRAQWRDCRLEPAALRALAVWLEDYRRFWDETLQSLHVYLDRLHLAQGPAAGTRTPDHLDSDTRKHRVV